MENIFFAILEDLNDYLDDLILVGGWLPYVYSRYLWNNLVTEPVITTDIDFGVSIGKVKSYPQTIYKLLSKLDYKERHPRMDRMYPVVLYKEGKVRLDFIAPLEIKNEIIEKFIGRQIDINRIDKFDFLLKHTMAINVSAKRNRVYKINCPKPSAFLYHKCAAFTDRYDKEKQSKDLYYAYFILRYAPNIEIILSEVTKYLEKGYFKDTTTNIREYFDRKTSKGCLMIEKENGPDNYIEDLRQDIYERFQELLKYLEV